MGEQDRVPCRQAPPGIMTEYYSLELKRCVYYWDLLERRGGLLANPGEAFVNVAGLRRLTYKGDRLRRSAC